MSSDASGEKSTGYIPPPYVDPDDAQSSSQESNPNHTVQLDPLPTSKSFTAIKSLMKSVKSVKVAIYVTRHTMSHTIRPARQLADLIRFIPYHTEPLPAAKLLRAPAQKLPLHVSGHSFHIRIQ